MSDFDRTQSAEVNLFAPQEGGQAHPWLVIAWSADQPELVGHSATLLRPALIGRGPALPGDPAPRLAFGAERPHSFTPGPSLGGAHLSRQQLLLQPLPGPALAVRSLGRHPLFLNGQPVTEAVARPGDTLHVLHALVLLLLARPMLAVASRPKPPVDFPLGAADPHGLVGESLAMWKLREALAFAAPSDQHVLVRGESGSGKELAARALHALSGRSAGPFVARNAATLPEGLVDAELFGTARGYPHAGSPERPGLLGEAEGGTLFLDEMAELRHDLQAHLLRVADPGGDYQRLGESRRRPANVRLVAATNRPAEALKHDLAARFRLHVTVPGLNERREDLPFLLRELFARAVRAHPGLAAMFGGRDAVQLGAALDGGLVEGLLRHPYTHHLRELDRLLWTALAESAASGVGGAGRVGLTPGVRGLLEAGRARAAAETGAVLAGAAGAGAVPAGVGVSPVVTERQRIEAALAQTGGKVAPASRILGLGSRHALYRLMEKHGIRRAGGADGEGDE